MKLGGYVITFVFIIGIIAPIGCDTCTRIIHLYKIWTGYYLRIDFGSRHNGGTVVTASVIGQVTLVLDFNIVVHGTIELGDGI